MMYLKSTIYKYDQQTLLNGRCKRFFPMGLCLFFFTSLHNGKSGLGKLRQQHKKYGFLGRIIFGVIFFLSINQRLHERNPKMVTHRSN